jgi:hypothetical protein
MNEANRPCSPGENGGGVKTAESGASGNIDSYDIILKGPSWGGKDVILSFCIGEESDGELICGSYETSETGLPANAAG